MGILPSQAQRTLPIPWNMMGYDSRAILPHLSLEAQYPFVHGPDLLFLRLHCLQLDTSQPPQYSQYALPVNFVCFYRNDIAHTLRLRQRSSRGVRLGRCQSLMIG